jgi:hypothetical protein
VRPRRDRMPVPPWKYARFEYGLDFRSFEPRWLTRGAGETSGSSEVPGRLHNPGVEVTKHRRCEHKFEGFELSADASRADRTRLVACAVGDIPARLRARPHVRGVRVAGYRPGGAGRAAHRGGHAGRGGDGRGGVVSRGVPVLLPPRVGRRPDRADAGPADRGPAARRGRGDRRGGRRHPDPAVGPKVFGAFWTHDGSAQDPNALGRGNRWIIAGIVVRLPFCSHPVCLPVLLRLWGGKGTDSPVRLAGQLITLLANEFPDRRIHIVGDAAYHGRPLLAPGTTITTRLPSNAALYAPAPPRTGKRGRPRLKGERLGIPAEIAATAPRRRVSVDRYGRSDTVEIAVIDTIWYGPFGNTPGHTVLVREPGGQKMLAIFTHRHRQLDRSRRHPLRASLADRDRDRRRQATARRRSSPQPVAARGRAHRSVPILRLQPRRRLVRPARLPPRRPRQPPRRAALVHLQDRPSLRGHDRQAPQNPCRIPNYGCCRSSARPAQIPRLRTGLRCRRRVTAKVKIRRVTGKPVFVSLTGPRVICKRVERYVGLLPTCGRGRISSWVTVSSVTVSPTLADVRAARHRAACARAQVLQGHGGPC